MQAMAATMCIPWMIAMVAARHGIALPKLRMLQIPKRAL